MAPKPEDASTLNKDINSNISVENDINSIPQPSVANTNQIPTPQTPVANNVNNNNTNDTGDDGAPKTIKPSFTNPEELSEIEVL